MLDLHAQLTPIPSAAHGALEKTVGLRLTHGDLQGAATITLEAFGSSIFRYVRGHVDDEARAMEAFAWFAEELWSTLPDFQGTCTLRAWAFRLARRAALRHQQANELTCPRRLPDGYRTEIRRMMRWVLNITGPYHRTAAQSWIIRIRRELRQAEREVLCLRVDHHLSYRECAAVLIDDEALTDGGAQRRLAASLRKRFQRTRRKLVALAHRDGLLPVGT